MRNSNRGYALIEFAFSALTCASVLVFFLTLLYTAIAKLWLSQLTYEAAICLAQGRASSQCEFRLKDRAAWAQAEVHHLNLHQRSRIWRVEAEWRLLRGIRLSTEKTLTQESFY